MSNPALTYDQPDVETLLTGLLPGSKVWATDTRYEYPFWWSVTQVNVRTPGTSKRAASDAAWDAHAVLVNAHRGEWADGVLLSVEVVQAPAWAPDEDGGPVYDGVYLLTARPRRNP